MWFFVFIFSFIGMQSAEAARVKDISDVYGVRDNMIFGYGLVTGLKRSGDSNRNIATIRTLAKRLQGLGITLTVNQMRSRNVAAVMVTANVSASARPGQKIDIIVSSTGDANSLEGGVLQLTPLQASNGDSYALAQGPIVLGGFSATAKGAATQKNHTTTGRVPLGATIEKENPNRLDLQNMKQIDFLLRHPDFTTAKNMADAINAALRTNDAVAVDEAAISVKVPDQYADDVVSFLALVEAVDVTVDSPAVVVINERTGTVVMGSEVRIKPVALAHGGLKIEVKSTTEVSQPNPLAGGTSEQTTNSTVSATEEGGGLTMLDGATIGDLVTALNEMGVKPRDLVQILITIRKAGALHAELEVL